MPMNDDLKLRLSVEGATQGAKELEKVTQAVDGTEKAVRKLGTSAKPGATPYDAVAVAAERMTARVKEANQVITTSTQSLRTLTSATSPKSRGESTAYESGLKPFTAPTTSGTFVPLEPAEPGAAGAGAAIGGLAFAGGILAAAGAAAKLYEALHNGSEQVRILDRDTNEAMHSISKSIATNPVAALGQVSDLVHGIDTQLEDLANKSVLGKLGSALKQGIGLENDFTLGDKLEERRTKILGMLAGATERQMDFAEREQEIQQLIIEGKLKAAQLRKEELADAKEMLALQRSIAELPLEAQDRIVQNFAAIQRRTVELRAQAAAQKDLVDGEKELAEKSDAILQQRIEREDRQRLKDSEAEAEAIDLKEKFDRQQEEAAAKQALSDAERLEQMKERGAALKAQLAGDSQAARLAEIQLRLEKELAAIRKGMAPERQAEAEAIARQNAELERQAELKKHIEDLTKKAVAAANAEIAQRDKNGDQLREERTAKLTRESKARGQVGRELDAEDKARADARGRQMTPAEREAMRQEKFKERGLDEHGREAKPKAAKDLFAERDAAKKAAKDGGGKPMSEKDIAGDAPVEVDAAPVAQAVEQAGQGMATDIVSQITSAIAGVKASVQIDAGSIVNAVNSAMQSVRTDLQAQIDKLASRISSQ